MNKHLIQLVLFGLLVVTEFAWFLSSSGESMTFVMGITMGVGLVGVTQSALKLYRPGKYLFVYEANDAENV